MRDEHTPRGVARVDCGFTLVEVIVSMVLLGLAALLVLPLVVTGLRAGIANRDIATAAQLADAELERARSSASTLAGCAPVLAAHNSNLGVATPGYSVRDTVTGTCVEGGLLTVSVTVTPTANASRSATAATEVVIGP